MDKFVWKRYLLPGKNFFRPKIFQRVKNEVNTSDPEGILYSSSMKHLSLTSFMLLTIHPSFLPGSPTWNSWRRDKKRNDGKKGAEDEKQRVRRMKA